LPDKSYPINKIENTAKTWTKIKLNQKWNILQEL